MRNKSTCEKSLYLGILGTFLLQKYYFFSDIIN